LRRTFEEYDVDDNFLRMGIKLIKKTKNKILKRGG